MKRYVTTGFTIIELLVVIAIIGILASVILGSLNDARKAGLDAKIQGEMDAIAKRSTIDYSQNLTYDTVCGSNSFSTSTAIYNIVLSIQTLSTGSVTCNSDTTSFAMSAPLSVNHWCIDSTGVRKEILAALPTSPARYTCEP